MNYKKLKYIITIVIVLFVSKNATGQMITKDLTASYENAMRWAEEKTYLVDQKLAMVKQLAELKKQLIELEEIKEKTEKKFRLAKEIQEDLERLGSVADGGLPAFVNFAEIVLGESLNPNDYIPDNTGIGVVDDFRSAVTYNASSQLSGNTKMIQAELFTYNQNSEQMQHMTINTHMAGLIGLRDDWRTYEMDQKLAYALKKQELAIQLRKAGDSMMKQLSEDGVLSMTHAERMEMMIKSVDMYRQAILLEQEYTEEMGEVLEANQPTDVDMVEQVEENIDIRINYTLDNVVTSYEKNKGFRLSQYDKKSVNKMPKLNANPQNN